MSEQAPERNEWSKRTTTDLSCLLVELGRVCKGMRFYAEDSTARGELLDRAYLAFQVELERAGRLELWIDEAVFRASDVSESIPHGHMADLARVLLERDVQRIEFTPALTRDAFHSFVDVLSHSERDHALRGGLARSLASRGNVGIAINGGEEDALAAQQSVSSPPPVATASLGSALLARSRQLVINSPSAEKPDLEECPLEAPAGDERGERLLFRLLELDRCVDDAAYAFLAKRIVECAGELFDEGLTDECYRATLVLADHAVGEGGRPGLQASVAKQMCLRLTSETRLDDLIDRACSSNAHAGVRATQVLLLLAERSVTPLFERLAREDDPDRSAQLTAILITLGEIALPVLSQILADPSIARAQLATRLTGEIQNPEIVPRLVEALHGPHAALRLEAARALAHIASEGAVDALIEALSRPLPELPEIAATCLGHLGDPRAAQPILAALERAMEQAQTERAREMIRALGQLGSERVVPKLVALLERRSLLRRKSLRKLKLAALVALERLPGREARRALQRASHSRDASLRERAKKLLGSDEGAAAKAESLQ